MPIPRSANIKIALLAIAVGIVIGTLFYTQRLVRQLLLKEREVADLYARSLEFIANSPAGQTDYSFIFDEVISAIDFPMVLTDRNHQPVEPLASNARNVELDTSLTAEEQRAFLIEIIKELDTQNPPVKVALQDTIVLSYVHYGESELIKQLRLLPYLELAVGGMFILIGYIGFSHIKRSEQSNIWVGMAKETAHQLGTPLSSMMAWVEMLKMHAGTNSKQLETITDMENDLKRLHKVTERFSKIGSKPNLKQEDVGEIIRSVTTYFKRRLPTRFAESKQIDISIETTGAFVVAVNRELFEWVIENLIKNALDAMEDGSGAIVFSLSKKGSGVYIDVRDTGKGIDMRYKKDIFRPGYSTKQRGWGLGLSLSKRIIEEYHKGKLFVKESKIGKGTTFRIRLRG